MLKEKVKNTPMFGDRLGLAYWFFTGCPLKTSEDSSKFELESSL